MTRHEPHANDNTLAGSSRHLTDDFMLAIPPTNAPTNSQSIISVDDSIDDIWKLMGESARLFSFGSGVGSDWSTLRSTKEKLSGGGRPSGPISFMRVQDATGGTIKSGEASRRSLIWADGVVAGDQPIYTAGGPMPAAELVGAVGFICLIHDPALGRYAARRAYVVPSGDGPIVSLRTDKGRFRVSPTASCGISPKGYCLASDLLDGRRLFACTVDVSVGYPRVGLRDGKKGKKHLHRLVAEDVMGVQKKHVIHHINEDKNDCRVVNLRPYASQSEHVREHMRELVERGEHPFQKRSYPKWGADNPMHKGGALWKDKERSRQYRAQKRQEMMDRDPVKLQRKAVQRRLLNIGHTIRDAGCTFDTMDEYLTAHEKVIGWIGNKRLKREGLLREFGSISAYNAALDQENHRISSVTDEGWGPRYAILVSGAGPGESYPVVLWPIGLAGMIGSGVTVLAQ